MEVTLYGCRIYDRHVPGHAGLALLFHPWPPPIADDPANPVRVEVRPEDSWTVIAPEGAELQGDGGAMQRLVCMIGHTQHALTPNNVHALAQLQLHGFLFRE
jgi:hypothetical protein